MSKKMSVFYPKYQLRSQENDFGKTKITFEGPGKLPFSTQIPTFGITETQKEVLRHLWWQGTPPAISISHDSPVKPDQEFLRFPGRDPHHTYHPYAMVVATVECLGQAPRKFKVYFCNVEVHQDATWNTPAVHGKYKEARILEI